MFTPEQLNRLDDRWHTYQSDPYLRNLELIQQSWEDWAAAHEFDLRLMDSEVLSDRAAAALQVQAFHRASRRCSECDSEEV